MLNFHRHHHLVILIAVDVCLGEWYPGLRQMSDFAVSIVTDFLL